MAVEEATEYTKNSNLTTLTGSDTARMARDEMDPLVDVTNGEAAV
jgi:hypothetical protein